MSNIQLIDLLQASSTSSDIKLESVAPEKLELEEESDLDPVFSTAWWIDLSVALVCSVCAGLMSGLTIGLASIDRLTLEIDAQSDPEAARMSKKIFPVIDKHHWMLVTLLLMNAICMETLPLFWTR